VGKQRVHRLMERCGIRARGKRRSRIATTDSRHGLPIAPDLLDRNFTVATPNQVWVGDITYVPTYEEWLFLAMVLEPFNRHVVGWSPGKDMRREVVIDTLKLAWFKRSPVREAGPILDSDRGSQYGSQEFSGVSERAESQLR
jgi:putative transposase